MNSQYIDKFVVGKECLLRVFVMHGYLYGEVQSSRNKSINPHIGSVWITENDNLREATIDDFKHFRVVPPPGYIDINGCSSEPLKAPTCFNFFNPCKAKTIKIYEKSLVT